MLAEENSLNEYRPQFSVSNASVATLIVQLFKQTVLPFKKYIASDFYRKRNLNEDDYTQIFIEQAQILIRKHDYPFNVNGQYRDITNLSGGFSDFYFFPNEQFISTASLFSVESKRLPSPERSREKEYLIGDKNNGGIERYKTGKHGRGLSKCGLLGFVEKEHFIHWLATINTWIIDLSNTNSNWNADEILSEGETDYDFCYMQSVAHRESDDIHLSHLWVLIN